MFQDKVIMHRLEHVCYCVEKGEWPVSRKYRMPVDPLSDSRSSTPVAGTPSETQRGPETDYVLDSGNMYKVRALRGNVYSSVMDSEGEEYGEVINTDKRNFKVHISEVGCPTPSD